MDLTSAEVRHIALLARIGMTDEEVARFQSELSSVLGHIRVLQEIETTDVPPTANGADLLNVTAPDQPTPSYSRDAVLRNAPAVEEGLFRIRAVLE
ncbi:MAG: Asp-tRNA(Asn)/Glu-tRNA(Gln) amidotransferase subunit GatC [Chloroflexi bacterium]|nr:Asp-tRNA(Asn)/Glu-tRNA(Gln) amidotransferase subunit GatC [Chloroflexota bacterium]